MSQTSTLETEMLGQTSVLITNNVTDFLTSYKLASFSRRTLLHGVSK